MPIDVPNSPMPSPTLYGLGAPANTYNADAAMAGILYIQTDATPGQRLWICAALATGGYLWEQLKASTASVVTPSISALLTPLTVTPATATYSGTVANAAAQVGMTARMEPLGADPGYTSREAWVASNGTINYRITNLSAANLTLAGLSFAIYLSKP